MPRARLSPVRVEQTRLSCRYAAALLSRANSRMPLMFTITTCAPLLAEILLSPCLAFVARITLVAYLLQRKTPLSVTRCLRWTSCARRSLIRLTPHHDFRSNCRAYITTLPTHALRMLLRNAKPCHHRTAGPLKLLRNLAENYLSLGSARAGNLTLRTALDGVFAWWIACATRRGYGQICNIGEDNCTTRTAPAVSVICAFLFRAAPLTITFRGLLPRLFAAHACRSKHRAALILF